MLTVLGAVSVLAHAPFFIWPLFILCFGVFLLRLDVAARHGVKASFRDSYFFAFGYFLASLYWIASAFLTRGSFYVLLAPFGMLLLPAGLALFWGMAGALYAKLSPKGLWRAPVFTVLFFLAEYLRGHVLSGFPWNLPGYIWKAGEAVSQSAALFGIYGLSLLTLLLAASFGAALSQYRRELIPLCLTAPAMLGLMFWGKARLPLPSELAYHSQPYIRVVQPQIDQLIKYDTQNYNALINTYLDLSQTPSAQPLTHIVWPEGAVPGFPLEDPGLMSALDSLMDGNIHLLMGVTRREAEPSEAAFPPLKYYNSLAALSGTGTGTGAPEITALYNKNKLVPFGEYFPGNKLIEAWDIPGLTAATASFDFGTPQLTPLPELPLASVQICYEAIFAGFTPRTKAGTAPEFILTVSNDSWFGRSTGPDQHFNQVRYRAIEEGLPIIRAASSGYSGFVDPYGRVLKMLPLTSHGVIDGTLPQAIAPPLYTRLHD